MKLLAFVLFTALLEKKMPSVYAFYLSERRIIHYAVREFFELTLVSLIALSDRGCTAAVFIVTLS